MKYTPLHSPFLLKYLLVDFDDDLTNVLLRLLVLVCIDRGVEGESLVNDRLNVVYLDTLGTLLATSRTARGQ